LEKKKSRKSRGQNCSKPENESIYKKFEFKGGGEKTASEYPKMKQWRQLWKMRQIQNTQFFGKGTRPSSDRTETDAYQKVGGKKFFVVAKRKGDRNEKKDRAVLGVGKAAQSKALSEDS